MNQSELDVKIIQLAARQKSGKMCGNQATVVYSDRLGQFAWFPCPMRELRMHKTKSKKLID